MQGRRDSARAAVKYGGVWCDTAIWLAAPLEQWLAPAFKGGAQLVAFTTLDWLVECWFLAAARRNAVIGRWRDTLFAELDAAALRAKRNRSAIGTELRASVLWRSTDTAGIDFDFGFLFMGRTLMHLRQHDAEVAAAFAGPTVTLFNSLDDALWMPTEATADSSGERLERAAPALQAAVGLAGRLASTAPQWAPVVQGPPGGAVVPSRPGVAVQGGAAG